MYINSLLMIIYYLKKFNLNKIKKEPKKGANNFINIFLFFFNNKILFIILIIDH